MIDKIDMTDKKEQLTTDKKEQLTTDKKAFWVTLKVSPTVPPPPIQLLLSTMAGQKKPGSIGIVRRCASPVPGDRQPV